MPKVMVLSKISLFLNYIEIVVKGIYDLYKRLFLAIFKKIKTLSKREYVYFLGLLINAFLTIPGWKEYKIEMNSQVIKHSISSDDFLLYLIGFGLMTMPLFLKLIYPHSPISIKRILFLSGFTINLILYVLTILATDRIAPVKNANLTIYFYIFGIFLLLTGTLGVLGYFFKPSTHLKFSKH